MPIKVLLADDSDIVRRAIRRVLEAQPKIELVGEAADFAQAIHMANGLRPDVIVMDLHLPDKNSVDLMNAKSLLNRGSRMLAISMWNDEDAKALAQRLGAVSLLDKVDLGTRLIPAIVQLGGNSAEQAN
jgi:two-component system, NarL family, response regulator DevR